MILMILSGPELRQLLIVIMWVSIPVVILSLMIATFWHYRRKRWFSRITSTGADGREGPDDAPLEAAAIITLLKEEIGLLKNAHNEALNAGIGQSENYENTLSSLILQRDNLEASLEKSSRRILQLEEQLKKSELRSSELFRLYRELAETREDIVIIN